HERAYFNLSDTVNLEIDFGNGTVTQFTDANGTNVLEATESKVNVVVEWYGNLAYVVEIAGVHNDGIAGLYWQYWINGDRAPFAANQMDVKSNDSIEWKRVPSTFTNTDTTVTTQIDTDLILGSLITVVLGPGFLGFLYVIKIRRSIDEEHS
ncbi:MAG: DUF4430 domain-containing protein, partial [Candidatus Thorarchaeota archaeon]